MTRRLATWSFAFLVIGAAVVDSTILTKEPKRQQANVDVGVCGNRIERDPANDKIIDDLIMGAAPVSRIRMLGPNDTRPQNRIDVDGMSYTFSHKAQVGGMPLELRAPEGCTVRVDGLEPAKAPLRAFFPDGTYEARSSCDGVRTSFTVVTDRAGSR